VRRWRTIELDGWCVGDRDTCGGRKWLAGGNADLGTRADG
jgi:hypothetical protein